MVVNTRSGRRAVIDGDAAAVRRLLDSIDGSAAARDLVAAAQPLVGTAVLLTHVIDDLEHRLSRAQLLRFPQQSPYAIARPYWENAIAVRARLDRLYAAAGDAAAFDAALCGLHRLATVGATGRNYYGAAGSGSTTPGEFRRGSVRTFVAAAMLRALQDWARQIGVRERLLLDGVIRIGETLALERREGGLACAHVEDTGGSTMRMLVDRARHALMEGLEASARGDAAAVTAACAVWHRTFVAAHPFGNVNNSIAMNVVNDLLERAGARPIPHLFLDHLAVRLDEADYQRALQRVVEGVALEFERGCRAGDAALPLLHLTMRADREAHLSAGRARE